jgi:toxin-antitoxin system, antitoxin component, xre family
MPAQWTADLIGEMHLARVSKKQLAEHLGVTPEYVSMVLNGHREPDGAAGRFREALTQIVSAQRQDTTSEGE